MSEISPVIQKEEARVLFPALKVVAGRGGETEAATRKKGGETRSRR
jgi:hypothetical protein